MSGRSFQATFSRELVREWSGFTADANPLHTDPVFAAETPFGRTIVHGHLIASQVFDEVHQNIGVDFYDGARIVVQFCDPIGVGSTVEWRWAESKHALSLWHDGREVVQVRVETATASEWGVEN